MCNNCVNHNQSHMCCNRLHEGESRSKTALNHHQMYISELQSLMTALKIPFCVSTAGVGRMFLRINDISIIYVCICFEEQLTFEDN